MSRIVFWNIFFLEIWILGKRITLSEKKFREIPQSNIFHYYENLLFLKLKNCEHMITKTEENTRLEFSSVFCLVHYERWIPFQEAGMYKKNSPWGNHDFFLHFLLIVKITSTEEISQYKCIFKNDFNTLCVFTTMRWDGTVFFSQLNGWFIYFPWNLL